MIDNYDGEAMSDSQAREVQITGEEGRVKLASGGGDGDGAAGAHSVDIQKSMG